jgi:hypothetical protein
MTSFSCRFEYTKTNSEKSLFAGGGGGGARQYKNFKQGPENM